MPCLLMELLCRRFADSHAVDWQDVALTAFPIVWYVVQLQHPKYRCQDVSRHSIRLSSALYVLKAALETAKGSAFVAAQAIILVT